MKTSLTNLIFILLLGSMLVVGAYAYTVFPDEIAGHWNAAGEADGYMSKFWGIFLFPICMVLLYAAFIAVPKIDPFSKNIAAFRKDYNLFWVCMAGFFTYLFTLSMAWNFGYRFNFSTLMLPAMALFFVAIGRVIEKSKRNWFVGIRTPWTLSSDAVWDKTHAFGAKLFYAGAGIILIAAIVQPELSVIILGVTAGAIAITTIVYSYLEYRKHHH